MDVVLDVPRTEGNRVMGNFMVDVRLMGPLDPLRVVPESLARLAAVGNATVPGTEGWSVLYHSRRPAMLPYESSVTGLVSMGLGLPWHVFGFRDVDRVVLKVGMWELLAFERGRGNVPTHARVEVVGASDGRCERGVAELCGAVEVCGEVPRVEVCRLQLPGVVVFGVLDVVLYDEYLDYGDWVGGDHGLDEAEAG